MHIREILTSAMSSFPDVTARKSRYSESLAFFVGGREIAHFHNDHEIDIRLTRAVIRELRTGGDLDARITVRGSSDWATFALLSAADVGDALRLVERAAIANRRS